MAKKKAEAPWAGADSEIAEAAVRYSSETLRAYGEANRFVEEHANLERAAVEGGYGRRQLFELIQNGADELIQSTGRIEVVLTDNALYCANEGKALTTEGVGALLSSHLSSKRGVEIGRFGLGFKSVLGITSRPEIFSRSGSIRFDPDEAARRIREIVPDAERTPVLRIADVLDPMVEADQDVILAELMDWATTVIRLRRDTVDSSWLPDDLAAFPSQFLLFSPHVSELTLDDREHAVRRQIRSTRDGEEFVLTGDGAETRWRVFSVEHEPSDAARQDAGAMANRDRIPLVWAVPTRRGRRGEFWAFFPTLDQTTLSGVVNAPWKLNEDRTRIIDGPFNAELIERLSLMVVENLPALCPAEDPGVVLELMPARGREAAGWADAELTRAVNDLATITESIPNQDGTLTLPSRINMHPADVPREVAELWSSQPRRPSDWVHPSVETPVRRPRAEMYMAAKTAADVSEWLHALLENNSDPVIASVSAIRVGAALVQAEPGFLNKVRAADIVLRQDGHFTSAGATGLFRRSSIPIEVDADYVDAQVDTDAGDLLALLGVRQVDSERALEARLQQDTKAWKSAEWDVFWQLVRGCTPQNVISLIEDSGVHPSRVKARNRSGEYKWLASLLLPGPIVQEGSAEDAAVVIDTHFHSDEIRVVNLLGAVSGPGRTGGAELEPWFVGYKRAAVDEYLEMLRQGGGAPNRTYIDFRHRPFAGPLNPLTCALSEQARADYTATLLRVADDLEPWTLAHTSQSRYPPMDWLNPVIFMIRRYGVLETTLGLRRRNESVGPGLAHLGSILPVARLQSLQARSLDLPDTAGELDDSHWIVGFDRVLRSDDESAIGAFYSTAALAGRDAPDELRCRVGSSFDSRPTATVTVADDREVVMVLRETGVPYLEVATPEECSVLIQLWGMADPEITVRTEVVSTPSGDAEPLADVFPMLRARLDPEHRQLILQPCEELRVERFTDEGTVHEDRDIAIDGETIQYRGDLEQRSLLMLISDSLSLDLTDADADAVVRNLDERKANKLKAAIRKAKDDASRLVLAIGVEELRRRVPKATLDAVEAAEGELDNRGVAELSLIVHGTQVLQEHSDVLEANGLEPPVTWAGSRRAVSFVRDLGFGAEFAGFNAPPVERMIEVDGPPDLGPLHDYQEIVVSEIHGLLQGQDGLRGLLSLPTGAGKTRVTIEALIEAFSASQLGSPVLWVAQTEELCEQAVQTWSELWRGKGPRRRLTISRLWGQFEAQEAEQGEQVVVATIQKLAAGVFSKDSYGWLKQSQCIVVDEAHTSIGTSYTQLLEWQGMARNKDRAPLIGLTATPFRGNQEEMRRLVARYGGRRLDLTALGGEDAYPHLQHIGILAKVDHQLLPGSEIELSGDELAELERFSRLPEAALSRLASDTNRNRTLLESIAALDPEWPVLLFAASVEHAQTMAALLTRAGIPSATISANTRKGMRRHIIDQYRRGQIRVITNYNVLAAGFDAPKVRALYMARPTYAPNAYQQMIGRGLRGPRNGGTERCLLVNVADNVEQFGEQLAFHQFDYLWGDATWSDKSDTARGAAAR